MYVFLMACPIKLYGILVLWVTIKCPTNLISWNMNERLLSALIILGMPLKAKQACKFDMIWITHSSGWAHAHAMIDKVSTEMWTYFCFPDSGIIVGSTCQMPFGLCAGRLTEGNGLVHKLEHSGYYREMVFMLIIGLLKCWCRNGAGLWVRACQSVAFRQMWIKTEGRIKYLPRSQEIVNKHTCGWWRVVKTWKINWWAWTKEFWITLSICGV